MQIYNQLDIKWPNLQGEGEIFSVKALAFYSRLVSAVLGSVECMWTGSNVLLIITTMTASCTSYCIGTERTSDRGNAVT